MLTYLSNKASSNREIIHKLCKYSPKRLDFAKLRVSPNFYSNLESPTCQYFYSDIFVISVTFATLWLLQNYTGAQNMLDKLGTAMTSAAKYEVYWILLLFCK